MTLYHKIFKKELMMMNGYDEKLTVKIKGVENGPDKTVSKMF